LAELNHERAKEIEAFRAQVNAAINQKNLDFQKWRFEQEKKIQYDILQLQQDFQRDLTNIQHQNALIQMRERLREDKSPINNLACDLLENSFSHGIMPLKVFLAPPVLDYDPSTGKPYHDSYEGFFYEEIKQFLHQGYLNKRVQLQDRSWVSKKQGGGSALQSIHAQLKSIPVLILESNIPLGELNLSLGYWNSGDISYTQSSILSGIVFSDLLYDSAKKRALEWEVTRKKLEALGKDEAYIKTMGGVNEENLQIYYKELADKKELEQNGIDTANSPFSKQYKITDQDYKSFYKYLAVWHCLIIGLYADILFLGNSWENTPLLPTLIPYLLEKYQNHFLLTPQFWHEAITKVMTVYGQFYDTLKSNASSCLPEIRMKLALSLANLPNEYKYLALEQGNKAFTDWLRANDAPSDKVFDLDNDADCQLLKRIIYQEDQPFLESLKLLLDKVKDANGIDASQSAGVKSLMAGWEFLNSLGIISNVSMMEFEKSPKITDPNSKKCDNISETDIKNQNTYTGEPTMKSNKENQQATEILKSLQRLFSDRPEVLRLLDPSNLDPDRIAGEVILDNYRNQEGFASTVNLYVTGRTGAGKTSLGNTIFDSKQKAMKSTGYMNCTDDVGCFQSANNLKYFDLPGVASKQDFENINRAALGIDQIFSKRRPTAPITQFTLSDYTDYQSTNKAKQETILVEEWQSTQNQLINGADVILYVIAPHAGFVNDDEDYLYDLLSTQKKKRGSSNVIIALNLHLNKNGSPKYTKENIEDVHKMITNIYNEVYRDHITKPVIIEINSLTGLGADKIAEEICKLLPADKLGKMEEVLGDKLKEKARMVRSKKFREALIYIASRLATFKVDQSFDNSSDIVLGSYAAVYSYSSRVFKKEVPNGENAYGVVSDFAGQTKESRTEKEITEIPIYETIENFRTVLKPIYDNVKKEQVIKVENPEKIPINRGLIGNFLWGNEEIVYTEEVQVHQTTSFEQIDMEEVEVSDGVIQKRTGYEKKLIGLRYLKGGYDIIKGILAIGLGVESLPDENIDNFNRIYGAGEKEVTLKIGNLKSRIEQIISNSDSKKAENEIISILMQALL
ncbi:MAG: GTPase, partial [Microcystis panniformis WG22]|nr:GTPase [Microcystis panniformis WG22]